MVGEYFYEQECTTKEIEITEVKKHPQCVNMTKVNMAYLGKLSFEFLFAESLREAMDS